MKKNSGFTLIELSLVLVIIGLIVGGILVGRDLIKNAQLKAVIVQKDKYTVAVNSFKDKYKAVPGDMSPATALKFNFFQFTGANAGLDKYGDNNEVVAGAMEESCAFECGAFWRQLSDAKLVGGNFGADLLADTAGACSAGAPPTIGSDCKDVLIGGYMPKSSLNDSNFGAGGLNSSGLFKQLTQMNINRNVFYLTKKGPASIDYGTMPSMSPVDMSSIDGKIDDGKPMGGKVVVSFYQASDNSMPYYSTTVDANSTVCTYGGSGFSDIDNHKYNANAGTGGEKVTCIPVFAW